MSIANNAKPTNIDSRTESVEKKVAKLDAELTKYKKNVQHVLARDYNTPEVGSKFEFAFTSCFLLLQVDEDKLEAELAALGDDRAVMYLSSRRLYSHARTHILARNINYSDSK